MRIQKIKITAFRNISDATFELNGKSAAFVGRNKVGKTTILSAISWCLTGADIENSAVDLKNIPFSKLNTNGERVVDVSVEMDVGSVRRTLIYNDKKTKQELYIDGVLCETLKAGETKIDIMLGLMNEQLYGVPDFNVRRFYLNPTYLLTCKEKSLRQFVIKHLCKENLFTILESQPEGIKNQLYELLNDHRTIEGISKYLSDTLKFAKKERDNWKVIEKYLADKNVPELLKDVKEKLAVEINKIIDIEQKQISLDMFVNVLNAKYQSALGNSVVVFSKGQGEDVWKECCKPIIEGKKLTIDYGSTAEKIITATSFIKLMGSALPVLIDEGETLDQNSTNELQANQVIISKVENEPESLTFRLIN